MSCFKKDGTLKKIYIEFVPLIENAAPYDGIINVGDNTYKYSCRRFEVDNSREKYITALLDELGVGYKVWPTSSNTIAVDIINNNDVLDIIKQVN